MNNFYSSCAPSIESYHELIAQQARDQNLIQGLEASISNLKQSIQIRDAELKLKDIELSKMQNRIRATDAWLLCEN